MIIKLLASDNETTQRMLNGCNFYGLKATFKKADPYILVEVNDENDVTKIFWLGVNIGKAKIDTPLMKSSY